jgi:hypothetical protein
VIAGLTHNQLQSSLRNALATFGAESTQYRQIKYMVDELAVKIALEKMDLSTSGNQHEQDQVMGGASA